MTSSATIVFANHRPECIEPAKKLMMQHDAVILEEPPDPHFQQMLTGEMDIASYLQTVDIEYPQFSMGMSETIRQLHGVGKTFHQVEPFLEKLIRIHELFADGGRPADLKIGTSLQSVYAAERDATAALLEFYRQSVRSRLENVIPAVKKFARADARRFALRDRMRADAVVKLLVDQGAWYIEAGPIHFPLWMDLKRRLPAGYPLRVTFLLADAVREMGYRDHLYAPGDLLTLLYRFHPNHRSRRADLLACRALIYNKLIAKEEIVKADHPYPHTLDELQAGAMVRQLSIDDCKKLYPAIRLANTATAREMVRRFMQRHCRSADCSPASGPAASAAALK